VGGARIIDRVADALRPHCDSLLIAPGTLDATGWLREAATAPDILHVRASITGIHAAIAAAQSDVIAVAWDMPFVPAALIGELRSRLEGSVLAVVPRVNGRAEPLCAAYSHAAADRIAALVLEGTIKVSDVLDQMGKVTWVDDDALARFGDPNVMFFNVNRAEDLARAEEIAESL
jgi:molybdopterin-guanine dinucleotide biosynthesis protein A